ncbi:MAG TPA: EAL domain-containing protein [Solirubrobacteraceae bacterium]|jgi:diguanylate cyclase (GGDEF)-like protein|nr:EAL domain-containing protein [Solirubrobacteraceae bacterium]
MWITACNALFAKRPAASAREPAGEQQRDVCLLGEELRAQTAEVVRRTVARSRASGGTLDGVVEERFERAGEVSTVAVARWMAGESAEAAMEVGHDVWQIFGALAAQRAAPLSEVTKRCWRWRDATSEVLRETAARLRVAPRALAAALDMLEVSLRLTLVHVCECFDAERRLADEELSRQQGELAFMATHDALTGLPNRALITDRLEQMLLRARHSKTPVAALFVDLDNFKNINDTLGHGAGDELLVAVAARLDGVVRDVDAVGRIGGDEFVIAAGEMSLIAGPELVAERLLDALKEPFALGDQHVPVTVTASIGIACGERASANDLLRDADIAMYRAKWGGRDRYVMFECGMGDAVQSRMELEMDLRVALENNEFFLAFQPTFNLSDMSPSGLEALIRWDSPTRGVVQPDDFIPLLEETGLIVSIGRWVLERACAQAATWREQGYPIGMAVNVSARQLDSDEIIADVEHALSDSGLHPSSLTLEITETTLMRDAKDTVRRLTAIKALGVRVAIDDFGTGYSSLSHLRQFPVDALKIDRSFITGLAHNLEGETLIHTLVQLGKALSIETIAEGIEQPSELSLLCEEQCDGGQGFLFARPLDVEGTERFLAHFLKDGGAVTAAPQHPL